MLQDERLSILELLTATIDPLFRAGKIEEVDIIVKKMMEVVNEFYSPK